MSFRPCCPQICGTLIFFFFYEHTSYRWLTIFNLSPSHIKIKLCHAGFEVLTAVVMKSTIFWDVTLHSPLKVNRRLGETCWHHLQDWRISRTVATCIHTGFLIGGDIFTCYALCDKVFSRLFFFYPCTVYCIMWYLSTQDIEAYQLCMKCT
jgi:hypothetical protein